MPAYPTQVIETARLLLRPYAPYESAEFVRVVCDPAISRWMGAGAPLPTGAGLAIFDRLQARVSADGAWPVWAVVVDGAVQGHAEVKPSPDARFPGWEVVYALLPVVQGRGLGIELAATLTDYAHGVLGLDEVHATVDPGNTPSLTVLRRLGYDEHDDLDEGEGPVKHLVHRADLLRVSR